MSGQFSRSQTADVVIIGGGVIGLTIARALAKRGLGDLVLIEKNELGREASWAAGGILAPQVEAAEPDAFFRLACVSRDMYRRFAGELEAESGRQVELDTTGTLYVAFDDEDESELRRRHQWQLAEQLRVDWLSGAEARRFEPCLSTQVRGALRFPDDHQIENRKLVEALIDANRKLGVRMIEHCEVRRLVSPDAKAAGVDTACGFISTPTIVIAAGAWSSKIETTETILIEPVRGQMLCFRSEGPVARHVLYSSRGYLIPRRDGRLLAGSTAEHVGFDKRTTEAGVEAIKSMACEIAPAVERLELFDCWAGFRPRASDNLPVLGPSENVDGVFYATGHYRNGILLAPITGELLADAIVTGAKSPLLEAFSPRRIHQKPDHHKQHVALAGARASEEAEF